MTLVGKMYIYTDTFHGAYDEEYIVMEELNHLVALEHTVNGSIVWISKHRLNKTFKLKVVKPKDSP